jgi:hypothetical protein
MHSSGRRWSSTWCPASAMPTCWSWASSTQVWLKRRDGRASACGARLLLITPRPMHRVEAHHIDGRDSLGSTTAADQPCGKCAAPSVRGEQATQVIQATAIYILNHDIAHFERACSVWRKKTDAEALRMSRLKRLPACGSQPGCAANGRVAALQMTLAVPAVNGGKRSPALSLAPPQQRRTGGVPDCLLDPAYLIPAHCHCVALWAHHADTV